MSYSFAYLTKIPEFKCYSENQWNKCSTEEYCQITNKHWGLSLAEVDFSSDNSIHNFVTALELYCEPSYRFGLIGSCIFIGGVIGALFITPYGDHKGR